MADRTVLVMNVLIERVRGRGLCWGLAVCLAAMPGAPKAETQTNEAVREAIAKLLERPPPEALIVSPQSGPAPLTVSITGPSRFAELLGSARGIGACLRDETERGKLTGYALLYVDWGDGTTESFELRQRCPTAIRHAYRKAGSFPVTAEFLSRPGATDGRTVDWVGQADIRVDEPKRR